jgi:colicin import membrane protein
MEDFHDKTEIRWTSMLALSAMLHIVVFLAVMFIPETTSSGKGIEGTVYEVDLVEMPSGQGANRQSDRASRPPAVDKGEIKRITKKDIKAKRIPAPAVEEKPLVVAKRTIIKKSDEITKPKVPPSKLIEKAISRIEKKVEEEDKSDPVGEAISKLKEKVGKGSGTSPRGGGGSLEGLPMQLYRMEVESWIKGNWSYPVAVRDHKKLEAIVLLKVKEDGTIMESTFKKRSADVIFDQSVEKAIEKSDPLPPFPEGYRKSYEEFEINFNLKDLEDS